MSTDDPLWNLMLAAIGQRIDSPQGLALVEAIGAKPLRAVTPQNFSDYTVAKPLGITVSATPIPKYRAYWPERREKRAYVNYINRIELTPPYSGYLPDGMHWGIAQADLDAIAKFELRGSRKIPYWNFDAPAPEVTLTACTSINGLFPPEKPAADRLLIQLDEERDFISAYAEYEAAKPLVYVEDAFFAAWCGLNGALDETRFDSDRLRPLRERSISPLGFLHGPCGRLLWSRDLRPSSLGFVQRYYTGLGLPNQLRWVEDVKAVFGASNHLRDDPAQMTRDDWADYDRIAPRIAERYAQWQRGELEPRER
ncbi:hypothetical protein [Lysobacter enzymogenes]|uniref:Uncharacterized protein n=1 Tax=Lysobacter enzymogenes TaxID=69 RepID=A0AAU9AL63_LYSEN|nr:hypothetical protein [Lysobacter enzymogenes]BAV99690.1 hypothetical protein LEN_4203 [Lysobacter enzymogenes]